MMCVLCCNAVLSHAFNATNLFTSVSERRLSANMERFARAGEGPAEALRDTFHIFAFLVEFKSDTFSTTTGTGEFGTFDFSIINEKQEQRYYKNGTYAYDKLPHDRDYFKNQLAFVKNYYHTVSRGNIHLRYSLFPKEGPLYKVDSIMTAYSPPGKRKKETYNDYYMRKTQGLVRFTRDALIEASQHDKNTWLDSLQLHNGEIVDRHGIPVLFMLIHAGASYLTDGGTQGAFGQDTPGDMIDAFINRSFFEDYMDTVGLDTAGVCVSGRGTQLCIDEVMMVSETSNQDSLNWGIHGIMVNQVARAMGIPDLYNTFSGFSATGAFGIMDFAGYSSGYGFVPPWPSAWTRHFMGWDRPAVVTDVDSAVSRLRAISAAQQGDTSMILVPINSYEYYLIENRQRNLRPGFTPYTIDTSSTSDSTYIASYPYNVDLESVVDATAGESRVVMDVSNYDVSLPATGVLIWHIDERIIRDRIDMNTINADSLYRGVHLVEADGITDFGIEFQDVFYQAIFDYGGAEDIFPHRVFEDNRLQPRIDRIGPWTRPATKSNDGGYTGLQISVAPSSSDTGMATEMSFAHGRYVRNYVDSVFTISVSRVAEQQTVSGTAQEQLRVAPARHWPVKFSADSVFFEPVLHTCTGNDARKEVVVVADSGRLYVIDHAGTTYGNRVDSLEYMHITRAWGSTRLDSSRSSRVRWFSLPSQAVSFPSVINGRVYIPTGAALLAVDSVIQNGPLPDSLVMARIEVSDVSTYAAHTGNGTWTVGTAQPSLVSGRDTSVSRTVSLYGTTAVDAVCAMPGMANHAACVQHNGMVTVVSAAADMDTITLREGIPPYTITAAQMDHDDAIEVVITDSRQGVWCLSYDANAQALSIAPFWDRTPRDWASYYTTEYNPPYSNEPFTRANLPRNHAGPAIADLDNDGYRDVVVGGSNGIYAYNYKGTLLQQWPSYLDTRYAYYRRSIVKSPAVIDDMHDEPFVLFAPPTGEHATFAYFHIDSSRVHEADPESTTVYYNGQDNVADSFRVTTGLADTLYRFFDTMVTDIVLPGGYVDVMNSEGARPVFVSSLAQTGPTRQSHWPVSIGAAPATAPMIDDMEGDGTPDLFIVSDQGFVYRWQLVNTGADTAAAWYQPGRTHARSFATGAVVTDQASVRQQEVSFYSYPNPAKGVDNAVFRFSLPARPRALRMDIFSYTGYHVFTWEPEGTELTSYQENWHGANEKIVSLSQFGPGVYRCRFEVELDNGETEVTYWKMAVVK
jgi:hypothetical protein